MKIMRIIISEDTLCLSDSEVVQVAWEFKDSDLKNIDSEVYYERYILPALIALQETV